LNYYLKSTLLFLVLFPSSVFLHELGHWIIYESYGVESWISLQKANIIYPEQGTEEIFFVSLFGGPIVTILLALTSYFLLTKFKNSLWLFIMGLINSSFRILPTMIGMLTSLGKGKNGVSDEGNILLRLFDSVLIREAVLMLALVFYILLIVRLSRTFKFPAYIKRKKLFILLFILLTVLISLVYPKLDTILFGI